MNLRWLSLPLLGLTGMATLAGADPSLVVEETARSAANENSSTLECRMSVTGAEGIRALEVRVSAPEGADVQITIPQITPEDGHYMFPPRMLGEGATQVFAVVLSASSAGKSPTPMDHLGTVRCEMPAGATGDLGISARAIDVEGAWMPITVSRLRLPNEKSPPAIAQRLSVTPNPGTGSFSIRYAIPVAGSIEISVFDLAGKQIRTVQSGVQDGGEGAVGWDGYDDDGRPAAAGIYFLTLKSPRETTGLRVALVR